MVNENEFSKNGFMLMASLNAPPLERRLNISYVTTKARWCDGHNGDPTPSMLGTSLVKDDEDAKGAQEPARIRTW